MADAQVDEVIDMLVVMTLVAIAVAGLVVMFFSYAIGDRGRIVDPPQWLSLKSGIVRA